MSKKSVALMLVFLLVGMMFAGCAQKAEPAPAATETTAQETTAPEATTETPAPAEPMVMGMITDTGGLGDQSFNDSAWMGLEKAEQDFGIERQVLESQSADDYMPNLVSFAEEGVDLIYGVGFLFDESMKTVADKFPDQKFAIIDSSGLEKDNVAEIVFAENEGSFLVGVIAGLKTETNVIGFIGGMKFPLIEKFEYGFKAGVKSVNPDAEVIVNYADSFEDSAKGKEIALVQHQAGADVIFHAAGGVGAGLIEAAKEEGFWAIGVDQDQSHLAPENVLCSMMKRVDVGVYKVAQSVIDGTFESGTIVFDAKNDGVGYSDLAGNLTDDLKAAADKYLEAIKAGTFVVPATEAEFDAFEAPAL
ncbi:MAG: basic rane protein [Clostridiales bacterium]|jgi:basic membrane protein A|nr:basic rane protein [Clostridiales bacterium]MDN5299093.1 basic rane protein [Clostridiales bacterium]